MFFPLKLKHTEVGNDVTSQVENHIVLGLAALFFADYTPDTMQHVPP